MSAEVLRATFAGRDEVLADLVRRVRENSKRPNAQHYLIIGERGSGKTTLLRMLELVVREDEELRRIWEPAPFAEEEFAIYQLKDLFLAILERTGWPGWPELRRQVVELSAHDPQRALDLVIQAVEQVGQETRRRFLVLIENLDQVLKQVIEGSPFAGERLRSFLQHSSAVMVVGSTTSLFDDLIRYDRPLYRFFAPLFLKGLDRRAAFALLRRRAELDGSTSFRQWTEEVRRRVKVITEMSGGNPRLIVALYELVTGGPLSEAIDTFAHLIDDLTPYYKARVEALPGQQRKVLDEVVRLGGAATTSAIATAVGIRPNLVNVLLARLKATGWLRTRSASDRRSTQYVIKDELFRVWYEMRTRPDSRARYSFLIRFFQSVFDADELIRLHSQLQAELEALVSPDHRRTQGARPADAYVTELCTRYSTIWHSTPHGDWDTQTWRAAYALLDAGRANEARELLEASRAEHQRREARLALAHDEYMLGLINYTEGRPEESLAHARRAAALGDEEPSLVADMAEVIESYGLVDEARGLYGKVLTQEPSNLTALQRVIDDDLNKGALVEARELVERGVAHGLTGHGLSHVAETFEKAGIRDQAADLFRRAVELQPTDVFAQVALAAFLATERSPEGEAALERAVPLAASEPSIAFYLGLRLLRAGRLVDAERVFQRTLEQLPTATEALVGKALVMRRLERLDEATSSLRRATETLDISDFADVVNVVNGLETADLLDEAKSVLLRATKAEPRTPTYWRMLASVLRRLGDSKEAETTVRRAIELDPNGSASHLELSEVMRLLGDHSAAVAAVRSAVSHESKDSSMLLDAAVLLWELGLLGEATQLAARAARLASKRPGPLREGFVSDLVASVPRISKASPSALPGQLEHLLDVVGVWSAEKQRSAWFAFLVTALKAALSASQYEDIFRVIERRVPDSDAVVATFRAAASVATTGDATALERLPEDVRRAAETLLEQRATRIDL